MPIAIPEIRAIQDQMVKQALLRLEEELNLMGAQAGVSGIPLGPPPNIAGVSVTGGNGDMTVTITDPAGKAQPNLGLHYFVEWSTDPSFPEAKTTREDIGSARGDLIRTGVQTSLVYVQVYSAFRTGPASDPVVFGTLNPNGSVTPTGVNVSGTSSPAPPGGGGGAGGGGRGFGGGGSRSNQRLTRNLFR